jgi:ferrous iron transport protein B
VENVIYYFYTNKDLEIPAILVINMADRMENKGTNNHLEEHLKTKIAPISEKVLESMS